MRCPRCGYNKMLARFETLIFVPLGDDMRGKFDKISDESIGNQARINVQGKYMKARAYCPGCGFLFSPEEIESFGARDQNILAAYERTSDSDWDDLFEADEEDAEFRPDEVPEEGGRDFELDYDDNGQM